MSSPDSIGGPGQGLGAYPVGTDTATPVETKPSTPGTADGITSLLNQQQGGIQRKQYQADPNNPLLTDPDTLDMQTGSDTVSAKRPFKRSERAVVLRQFDTEYQKAVHEYANQQTPPLTKEEVDQLIRAQQNPDDPDIDEETKALAQKLEQKATDVIRQKFNLPPTWSPKSTSDRDWTPTTAYSGPDIQEDPYSPAQQTKITEHFNNGVQEKVDGIHKDMYDPPLTKEELAAIVELAKNPQASIGASQRPEVVALAGKIREEALAKTRAAFALPDAWVPGTTNSNHWTPITVNGVRPIDKTRAFTDDFYVNTMQYLLDFQDGITALHNSLPPNHPGQITIKDFMKAIADAIQAFKKFLYENQANNDAKWVKNFTDERISAIEVQAQKYEKNMELMKEAKKKQDTMTAIQISLYVVAGLLAVAGIVGAIFTGGTSTLLIALAVTLISVGITIADSQTGFVNDAIQGVIDAIAALIMEVSGDEIDKDTAKIIAAVTLLVIVVALAIVLTCCSGGGGSSGVNAAANIADDIAVSAAKETAKSVTKQTAKAIVINVTMVGVTTAVGPITNTMVEEILKKADPDMDEQTRMIIAMLVALLVTLAAGAMMGVTMDRGMKSTKSTGGTDTSSATQTTQGLSRWDRVANKVRDNYAKTMERLKAQWSKLPEDTKNTLADIFDVLTPLLNFGAQASQASMHVTMGALLLQQAELEKLKGYNDADIHAMQTLVKLLDKLLENLQSTIGSEVKLITSLDNVQMNMYRGASAELNKGWSAVQA